MSLREAQHEMASSTLTTIYLPRNGSSNSYLNNVPSIMNILVASDVASSQVSKNYGNWIVFSTMTSMAFFPTSSTSIS